MLQSAVALYCLSINNEGLSSCNHRDSDCVCAKYKRFLLVESGGIALEIFVDAFDIWTSGSRSLSGSEQWASTLFQSSTAAQCKLRWRTVVNTKTRSSFSLICNMKQMICLAHKLLGIFLQMRKVSWSHSICVCLHKS